MIAHLWADDDRPACGASMDRGDSLVRSSGNVTCQDAKCKVPASVFSRSYIGKPVGPPSKGRRDIHLICSGKVDAFLVEIEAVCKKHGMALLPIVEFTETTGTFHVIKLRGSDWKTTEAGEKLRNAIVDGETFGFEEPA